VAIKFPGAGGRAECSSPHPFELWEGLNVRVWTVNHHGYGASSGTASLQKFAATSEAVRQHVANCHPAKKIVLIGNSLGCLSALYVAARFPVAGMYLRNPPPVAQLIRERSRYNWWNFGLAKRIADRIPAELDAVNNAAKCSCPALFVCAEKDTLVPASFQHRILQSYAGLQRTFVIENADHHDRISERQEQEFLDSIEWLRANVMRD
jgi:pimeloyl-ACP methyl ester carboxylesterase